MEATYYEKDVYGNTLRYPVNTIAKTIADLSGKKTLTPREMKLAETGLGIVWVKVDRG